MPEDVIRYCKKCGEPKLADRGGKKIQLRCKCDWSRGFYEQVRDTVEQEYWDGEVRTLADWSPPLFRRANARRFHRLINYQKIEAIRKLNEFCFKNLGNREGRGICFGIHRSIGRKGNLFMRGPAGSGKGLLVASLKMLCAMKGISVTPLPSSFAVFKTRMASSESFGKEGDESKMLVSQNYLSPQVLVLEGVRGEHRINSANAKVGHVTRGASAIDSLIATREARPGAMVMSSVDFAGSIGETLGDKMADLLESDKTTFITMLDPLEAEAILDAITDRRAKLHGMVASLRDGAKVDSGSMQERMSEEQRLGELWEAMFFDEAFRHLPGPDGRMRDSGPEASEVDAIGLVKSYPESVREKYEEFLRVKANPDGLAYRQGVDLARKNAIRSCKEVAPFLGARELDELAGMVGRATSMTRKEMSDLIVSTRALRNEMSGRGEAR